MGMGPNILGGGLPSGCCLAEGRAQAAGFALMASSGRHPLPAQNQPWVLLHVRLCPALPAINLVRLQRTPALPAQAARAGPAAAAAAHAAHTLAVAAAASQLREKAQGRSLEPAPVCGCGCVQGGFKRAAGRTSRRSCAGTGLDRPGCAAR
eukprot:353529-Chlamydomonas_euryale.AAC.20